MLKYSGALASNSAPNPPTCITVTMARTTTPIMMMMDWIASVRIVAGSPPMTVNMRMTTNEMNMPIGRLTPIVMLNTVDMPTIWSAVVGTE